MAMTDEELHFWGAFGRNVTEETSPLTPYGAATDFGHIWRVLGALEEKVRELSD